MPRVRGPRRLLGAACLLLGCGPAVDGDAGSESPGATDAAPAPGPEARPAPGNAPENTPEDDWYARRMRLRQPELVARLEALERQVASAPDDGQAREEYGWTLVLVGRIDDGLVHLARAVELGPQVAARRRRLGVGLFRAGRYEPCVEELTRAVELAAGDAEAHYYLGAALERLGRGSEALEHFRLASEAAPQNPEARYREALLLADADPERARIQLESVLELDPFHPGAALNLARLYRAAGRPDAARAMLARHQEIGLLADLGLLDAPLAPERFLGEAGYYERQGKLEEALDVVDRGLERHWGDARLVELRARLARTAGDVDR